MNGRQKRSSGGYDLRRKVAKKRWDEDFEYYFSKIGVPVDSSLPLSEADNMKARNHDDDMLFDRTEKVCNISGSGNNNLPGKRARGRPRKVEVLDLDMNVIVSGASVTENEFREEIIGCSKEFSTSNDVDGETCKDQVILPLSVIQRCDDENIGKQIQLEATLSPEEITCLQEEEVSSSPEMDKNIVEDSSHMVPGHETVVVQMAEEGGELVDIDEISLVSQKVKRRYRRSQLNEETIQKLCQLSSDDKIECDECHKLLKPSSYRQHVRTHTGVKPFACDMCDAKFTRKGDVERHVRIVHNKQKPYKCSKCHRCFGDKKNLRWHLMNHDKRLFYACEVCGFKFGKREYWENHVRIIHPTHANPKSEKCVPCFDGGGGDERLYVAAGTLLPESENSVDDPIEEKFCTGNAGHSYSQGQKLLIKNNRTAIVSKIDVENEKKETQLRHIVPGVLNISSARDGDSSIPDEHLTDSDVMGTVVIQLDTNGTNTEILKPAKTLKLGSLNRQNVFHINPSDVLELVETDPIGQKVVYAVNEQCSEENETEKLVVSVGGENIRILEYTDDVYVEDSKVYGIMLTDNLEKENNVHNFAGTLLTAVDKGSRKHAVIEAS